MKIFEKLNSMFLSQEKSQWDISFIFCVWDKRQRISMSSFFSSTMKFFVTFLLLFIDLSDARRFSTRASRYRISPTTGVRIALPSNSNVSFWRENLSIKCIFFVAPEQLEWQQQEIGVLIHFNIATYLDNHDGCTNEIVPPASVFNPYRLNTNNWAQTMIDLGAKYAVLVAKVTFFSLWKENSLKIRYILAQLRFPHGSNERYISSESVRCRCSV